MGWERGYYYRARKVNGRVVREYVGSGYVAELSAQMDAALRADREAERAAWREEKAGLERLDAEVERLVELTDLVARAALLAAGFHQHKRGEWRKRRGQDSPCSGDTGDAPVPGGTS
jgi:hypothetical protein